MTAVAICIFYANKKAGAHRSKCTPPEMTLHPLTSKWGAFVLKLGLAFKNKPPFGVAMFLVEAK